MIKYLLGGSSGGGSDLGSGSLAGLGGLGLLSRSEHLLLSSDHLLDSVISGNGELCQVTSDGGHGFSDSCSTHTGSLRDQGERV